MLRQSRRNWISSPMSTSLLLSLIGPARSSEKYLEIRKHLQGKKGFVSKSKVFLSPEYKLQNALQGIAIETEKVDFTSSGAKKNISSWVTNSGFKNWDPDKNVASSTKYVLLNVTTLQMPWHATQDCGGLMTVYNTFSYTEDIKYEARILELPLQNSDFKFIILVPIETDVLYSLFNKLTNEGLNSAIASIQPLFTSVTGLKAPKIEFQAINELRLELCNCGITAGTIIDLGGIKIDESGAIVKCLTCIHSEKARDQLVSEPETKPCIDGKSQPILFAINYKDDPIFTGQLAT